MDSRACVQSFLAGLGPDDRGRALEQILGWDDQRLEDRHDFIQWLFPLPEPSGANPFAPVPSLAEFERMRADPAVVGGVRRAFARMLAFYGLAPAAGAIGRASNWDERAPVWARHATHNDLRLTRIMRCMTLLGLCNEARALEDFLEGLAQTPGRELSLRHWRHAVGR